MIIERIKNKNYVKCFYTEKEKEYFKNIEIDLKEDFYFIELKVYKALNSRQGLK